MLTLFDQIGMILAFLLTVAIFSYLLGDNPLFRLAAHLLVGVAAGYVTVLVVYTVIWQRVFLPVLQTYFQTSGAEIEINPISITGFALGVWLLLAQGKPIGKPVVAFLAGVGAATALGGGLFYTILPQSMAAAAPFEPGNLIFDRTVIGWGWIGGAMMLLGTVATLVYFNFRGRATPEGNQRPLGPIEIIRWVGQIFVALALGALFAGIYSAALTVFSERINFILNAIWEIFKAIPLQ